MNSMKQNANWIAFQIRDKYGFERTPDQIRAAIFEDSGRKADLAKQMADYIANDQASLESFAKTLYPGKRSHVFVWVLPHLTYSVGLISLGFVFGFMFGLLLRW